MRPIKRFIRWNESGLLAINNYFITPRMYRCSRSSKMTRVDDFLSFKNLLLWKVYKPSDKNNYTIRSLDLSSFLKCFPFSNPSTTDKSVNGIATLTLVPFSMHLTEEINELREFGGCHPHSAPISHEEFFAIWRHQNTAITITVQKPIW